MSASAATYQAAGVEIIRHVAQPADDQVDSATDIAGARDLGMDAILVAPNGGIGALPLDL